MALAKNTGTKFNKESTHNVQSFGRLLPPLASRSLPASEFERSSEASDAVDANRSKSGERALSVNERGLAKRTYFVLVLLLLLFVVVLGGGLHVDDDDG
jgi:energy-coupling factor transporter transmembrane protein EcfT